MRPPRRCGLTQASTDSDVRTAPPPFEDPENDNACSIDVAVMQHAELAHDAMDSPSSLARVATDGR
jgi:hypothetical protein